MAGRPSNLWPVASLTEVDLYPKGACPSIVFWRRRTYTRPWNVRVILFPDALGARPDAPGPGRPGNLSLRSRFPEHHLRARWYAFGIPCRVFARLKEVRVSLFCFLSSVPRDLPAGGPHVTLLPFPRPAPVDRDGEKEAEEGRDCRSPERFPNPLRFSFPAFTVTLAQRITVAHGNS